MSTTAEPLRVLSFGAGAIGAYIGGSLALHGAQVVFLERPAAAAAVRQSGLHLQLAGQEHHLPAPLIAESLPAALAHAPFDVALFALKSFDTAPALAELAPFAADLPPVLCLQNGVENESALAAALGADKVIPATVTSAIGRRAAGSIVLERLRGLGIAAGHPLSDRLYAAFQAAGLQPRLYPDAPAMKWSKLLTNLLANAVSAILDLTPAEIFVHPALFNLEMRQLREALAVMAAQGLRPVDLPGTPVRLLAIGARLPEALARPLMGRAVGGGRGAKMPSFHIDLHTGRGASEVGYLNGAVWRFGQSLGVAAPVNRLLTETLQALTSGDLPLTAFARQPQKLLDLLTS